MVRTTAVQRRGPDPVGELLLFLLVAQAALAWNPLVDRRSSFASIAVVTTTTTTTALPPWSAFAATAPSAIDSSNLSLRFQSDILKQPPVSMGSQVNGVDNLYFPNFLQGTWQVTQTLVGVSTPLGLAFAGGPNGRADIAEKSMTESRERLNRPVQLQLRFVATQWGVAEDRVFNTRQRLDAFAGRSVVASVEYANVGGSNRASVLAMGGSEQDPLQTTLVRFKGPAAQKVFVTGHGTNNVAPTTTVQENETGETTGSTTSWIGYEMQRSIFALTNANTAPPITTDSELLWNLQLVTSSNGAAATPRVKGQFRIVGYLNPTDKLYFEARNRAVSIQDYTLDMTRIGD